MRGDRFDPVKIGVIGLGSWGRLHAATLAGLAEAELVALEARRQASLDAVTTQLGEIPGWLDLDAAIAESDAEAWVVASSTASHVPITRALLEAGKSVLLEKPIADTLAEAETLAPLVHADSSNLMLGHIVLFSSEFRQLMDEVGGRGKVSYFNCVRHRRARTLEVFPDESPFHLTMVHDLYAAQALMDRVEPTGFSAQVHRTAQGAVDVALAQLEWADGTLASFAAGFIAPMAMGAGGFDRMEVYGDGWMARLLPNPRPITVWDEEARWPMPYEIRVDPSGPTGMMAEELRCFCRVVRGMEPVPAGASYADAMQVQRWLDRLEASADSAFAPQ
ncbi:MAG: Gfo/Idh/MocA family oxidoreductase [Chloroflexota bacterium]|nr:Gfo/Idh/MocA family oxidoreductase [Chloroflexota bacterium]